MDPERWREFERLYDSALERPSREREAFLESECHGDDDLRLEVQSLLSRATSAENFLDRPAAAVAAQMVSRGLRSGSYQPNRSCASSIPSQRSVTVGSKSRSVRRRIYRIIDGRTVVYARRDSAVDDLMVVENFR